MAGRISTYRLFKKIHLYASMILFVQLLMYVVTGFILSNHNIFPHGEVERTSTHLPFAKPDNVSFEELNKYVKSTYQINGRASEAKQRNDGRWEVWISRPGLFHHIIFNENMDTISIYQNRQMTLGRVASRLHFMRHYEGGWKYVIWAILYDLSAIALIVFSITGVYMWWRLRKKYKAGYYFLAFGVLVPAVFIILLYI